jgi:hypothetical protein
VEIENIEEMRLREGIDDVELRQEIGRLRVGDLVNLTLLSKEKSAGENGLVRITSIRGAAFRGKLVKRPTSPGLSGVQAGALIAFTAAHIHSVPRKHLAEAD